MSNCIGLFGTCDGVAWRDKFVAEYTAAGVIFFNPDAGADWHPGMIDNENKHLQEDNIILFPVLAQSLGLGSLGEIGFSVLNSFRSVMNGSNQYLIVLIDDDCTDERKSEAERINSVKARKLVKSKMMKVKHPNVFVVDTLEDMLTLSIQLYTHECHGENLKLKYGRTV